MWLFKINRTFQEILTTFTRSNRNKSLLPSFRKRSVKENERKLTLYHYLRNQKILPKDGKKKGGNVTDANSTKRWRVKQFFGYCCTFSQHQSNEIFGEMELEFSYKKSRFL